MKTPAYPLLTPAVLALGVLLAGCGDADRAQAPKGEARTVQARAEQLALSPLTVHHASPGTVVALERVEVASRLMGYLRDLAVVEGQAVARGQRLFTVDPVDVEGQVEQARHAVRQAEDAYQDAKADFERYASLQKEEVVTRQQFEKMKLQHDLAATRLAQARSGLQTASGQLRYASVASPILGVVTRKLADNGDLAAPGQPILVLESAGRLQVETQAPGDILDQLRPGQTVTIEVDGRDAPVSAKVARISPAADPVSRTFMVRLDLSEAGMRSGDYVRVLFPRGQRQAMLLPAEALVRRAGIEGVFVVNGDNVAHFRMVRVGDRQGDRLEIQAGVNPGERVVVEGADQLESGDKVNG
ncbi:MAG: efflux RND transporter periplasmic adaptor subunit [Thiobacillaceae bacterium]|jgi:RND family efflux transporter MFP subunit|nr:efflux RND transporter periplasmic adaptor subunit [Thiobacillaceae bacterium]